MNSSASETYIIQIHIYIILPLSVTVEDYLKIIHELTEYNGYASLADIAPILGTSRQSAYDEISILVERDFVERIDRGKYQLTSDGQREANRFLRKHRVAEILLWKGLGLRWSSLDDQAMGIEHGMTEEIMEKVCLKFGCESCPHGNPIPSPEGDVGFEPELSFEKLSIDQDYHIKRVIFETPVILSFLEENKLFPDTVLKRINEEEIEFMGKSIKIPKDILRSLRFAAN
jgi:Mn-dependent transcriptional regulator